jgi:regulatory protein
MTEHVIEYRPRPRQRVYIKLSGGRSFTIPVSDGHPLRLGLELSEAEVERLVRLDQYHRGKDKAFRLLSIRARTRHEIAVALENLGIEPSIRGGIVEELEELGLIDDEKFTRDYIQTKMDVKQLGPHRLKHLLSKLGVKMPVIETALAELFDTEVQEALSWRLVDKRLSRQNLDEKAVRQINGLLQRKGFDYEVVNRVSYALLKRTGQDVEDPY